MTSVSSRISVQGDRVFRLVNLKDPDASHVDLRVGDLEQHAIVNDVFSGHIGSWIAGQSGEQPKVSMFACPRSADQDWHVDDVEVYTLVLCECPDRA